MTQMGQWQLSGFPWLRLNDNNEGAKLTVYFVSSLRQAFVISRQSRFRTRMAYVGSGAAIGVSHNEIGRSRLTFLPFGARTSIHPKQPLVHPLEIIGCFAPLSLSRVVRPHREMRDSTPSYLPSAR